MPEMPPNLRPPFTSSGLNTLLKDASGIRRMGEGAAEAAEKLGTLLMAKAAAQAGEKARAARRTTLFKEDVEGGFTDVLKGAFAEPPKPTPETMLASLESMSTEDVTQFTRLLANWVAASKATRLEQAGT
jgi:histone H3/H4